MRRPSLLPWRPDKRRARLFRTARQNTNHIPSLSLSLRHPIPDLVPVQTVQSNPRDSILLYKEEIPPQELQQHIPEPSGSTLISFSDFASIQTPISSVKSTLSIRNLHNRARLLSSWFIMLPQKTPASAGDG